jgi:hypothetical protein
MDVIKMTCRIIKFPKQTMPIPPADAMAEQWGDAA